MSFPFFISLLWNNVISSIVVFIILFIKKSAKKYTSADFQYYIWTALIILLFIPFLPLQSFSVNKFFVRPETTMNSFFPEANHMENYSYFHGVIKDFSVSMQQTSYETVNILIIALWIAGILVFTGAFFITNLRLYKLKQNSTMCKDQKIYTVFVQCKLKMKIRNKINLYQSPLVNTPFSFGIIHPCVIVPESMDKNMRKNEINYIFMHELQHYKSKDIFLNYIINFSKIIYWFNPFIWYAVKYMRIDREIACDAGVLVRLDESEYEHYGNTIINYADKYFNMPNFDLTLELIGNKKQIVQRITEIACYKKVNSKQRLKNALALLLVIAIIITASPITTINVKAETTYSLTNTDVTYENLGSYFKGYNGSFVLYDLNKNKYYIHNSKQSSVRISPDSTYKIYSALFALENNVISPDNTQLQWNHTKYPIDKWNQDQDINSAMKYSVNWYFQELDSRQDLDALKDDFKGIKYGNKDLSGGVKQFWAESSLKISPIEQVEILTEFYNNTYNFDKENIQTVKDALLISHSNKFTLYGKTGTGNIAGKNINGWFIGFVESEGNCYIFATNIQDGNNCSGSVAANITMDILSSKLNNGIML